MFYVINIYKLENFESHLATYAKKYQYMKIASHFKVMLRDFAYKLKTCIYKLLFLSLHIPKFATDINNNKQVHEYTFVRNSFKSSY